MCCLGKEVVQFVYLYRSHTTFDVRLLGCAQVQLYLFAIGKSDVLLVMLLEISNGFISLFIILRTKNLKVDVWS